MTYDVVVPTVGRPSLNAMLGGLAAGAGPLPACVILVDDRKRSAGSLAPYIPESLQARTIVMRGGGRGPAAARNLGWRAGNSKWVAFLDDDVVPPPGWRTALGTDISEAADAAASQGCVRVPISKSRRPTDAERSVIGLEHASWATADIAYRREVLLQVGGFDERFPRAYREDADLGLRALAAGTWIVRGRRWVAHPVGSSRWWTSITRQRGNADDALMLLLHGPGWERRAGARRGTRAHHVVTSVLLAAGTTAAVAGRRRTAAVAFAGWLGMTARFAWQRAAAGPLTPAHLATITATSAAIPLAATGWWLFGLGRAWHLTRRPAAMLVDRDGTVIEDVPNNRDPARVRLRPGVREGLDRVRRAGIPVAVISNQSGVGRGLMTREQVGVINERVQELAGPLAGWFVCFHSPAERCACRKPAPGLVLAAARHLGVSTRRCAVVGDIEADMAAARRAGARAILVPTANTRPDEIERAGETAQTLAQAVALFLGPA